MLSAPDVELIVTPVVTFAAFVDPSVFDGAPFDAFPVVLEEPLELEIAAFVTVIDLDDSLDGLPF